MCWVGFDRGIRAVEAFGADGPADRWRALREEVHAEVCREGGDPARRTFTQSYGSTEPDEHLLMTQTLGFLPPSDQSVLGTLEAVKPEPTVAGTIHRSTARTGPSVARLPAPDGGDLL